MCIIYMTEADQASSTSSLTYIQFAVIVLLALERILKNFTQSGCRHVVCRSCFSSFEIDMASPRERSASEIARAARDEKEKVDEGANQS